MAVAVAAQVEHLPVPVGRDAVGQIARVDAGNRRLARRIDVHDDEHVGLVERGQELLPQSAASASSGAAGTP